MLKIFACECGFTREVEHHEYYDQRHVCPQCGVGHYYFGQSSKCMQVWEDSIRLLSRGHAEKAAQGFAQTYELWLKRVIKGRDPEWMARHPRADVGSLVRKIKALFEILEFTLIHKIYRNELEHDPNRLTTKSEASTYAQHVLQTMEMNLIELIGLDAWRRGEAGELNRWSAADSEEHTQAVLRYGYHRFHGNIGLVKTARAWWTAYMQGQSNWQRASW